MDAWVLDTNVIVSGLISPLGPPGRIVDALLARKLLIAVDDRILQEYREVLVRRKFRFDHDKIHAFLGIMPFQVRVTALPVKGMQATDPADTKFLEVAAAGDGSILVTGNATHYPSAKRGGVRVLSPAEAWAGFVS